jgi:S1-C subfamily serine protease/SpoVK/Ycf46/Vps4 family AAA+-type ATPase
MHQFNAMSGLFHYLVAPIHDYFILNSLEKLDFGEFMYRLLREQGYNRVVSFELNPDKLEYTIHAYDKLSLYSYQNPKEFEDLNFPQGRQVSLDEDREIIERFYDTVAPSPGQENNSGPKGLAFGNKIKRESVKQQVVSKEIGKIQTSADVKQLTAEIQNRIAPALNSERLKTAILFPVAIFQDITSIGSDAAKLVELIESDHPHKNIMIFYTDDENALKDLSGIVFTKKDFPAGVDWETVKNERLGGRFFKASSLAEDEIRNLLLKKIVEDDPKNPKFGFIPFDKVEGLAENIYRHFATDENPLGDFPKDYNRNAPLRSIGTVFDNEQVECFMKTVKTLLPKIKSRELKQIPKINGLELERIGGVYMRMSNIGEEEIFAELEEMVGLAVIKDFLKTMYKATKRAKDKPKPPGHYVFKGRPGTGKTEVARLMGKIFCALGVLPSAKVVEVSKSDLTGKYVGDTSTKPLEKCREALGGILLVDEAYQITKGHENDGSSDIVTTIMKFIEDHREEMCTIFTGYGPEMDEFMRANKGMTSRVGTENIIEFPDYTVDELVEIAGRMAKKGGFLLGESFVHDIRKVCEYRLRTAGDEYGNARDIREMLESAVKKQNVRLYDLEKSGTSITEDDNRTLTADDMPEIYRRLIGDGQKPTEKEIFAELDAMAGLTGVKDRLRTIYFAGIGVKEPPKPSHYVFRGRPGTGKTEVARLMSKILFSIGVLPSDKYIEVSKPDLTGKWVGDTSTKPLEKCRAALGGVLLVDEAYQITKGHSTDGSSDIVTTIMKFIEDHREEMCTIFTGYGPEMDEFINTNSGMKSRIGNRNIIDFPDYTVDELVEIAGPMAKKWGPGYSFDDSFVRDIRKIFTVWIKTADKNYGNARDVRTLIEAAIENHNAKLGKLRIKGVEINEADTVVLFSEDIPETYRRLIGIDASVSPAGAPGSLPVKTLFERYAKTKETVRYDPANTAPFFETVEGALLFIQVKQADGGEGSGTGFLISPDGYALTCNHVVQDTAAIQARLRVKGRVGGSDSWHSCKVIKTVPGLDIALIQLEGRDFPSMKLAGEDREIKRGDPFVLIGYPLGTASDYTSFLGTVASEDHHDDYGKRCFINSEAKSGNSGSPVISQQDGSVIGILLGSQINRGENITEEINYIRPIKYFWEQFTQMSQKQEEER